MGIQEQLIRKRRDHGAYGNNEDPLKHEDPLNVFESIQKKMTITITLCASLFFSFLFFFFSSFFSFFLPGSALRIDGPLEDYAE